MDCGAVFLPADLPKFGKIMENVLSEDKPIVVIYPDGSEQLIDPAEVRAGRAQPR